MNDIRVKLIPVCMEASPKEFKLKVLLSFEFFCLSTFKKTVLNRSLNNGKWAY
jgi:hypothetical protein